MTSTLDTACQFIVQVVLTAKLFYQVQYLCSTRKSANQALDISFQELSFSKVRSTGISQSKMILVLNSRKRVNGIVYHGHKSFTAGALSLSSKVVRSYPK